MTSEAQLKAVKKFNEKRQRLTLDFYPSETDLWEHIQAQEKKQSYIKDLIRKDMNADMVNIVHCKDCVHYTDLSPYMEGECKYFSGEDNLYSTDPNGYCSCGKAKMNGE